MIPIDVRDLFPTRNLFADTNGDGYADDLGLMIQAPTLLTDPHIWAGLLNLTARLAFGVTSLDLPLTRFQNTHKAISRAVLWVTTPVKKPLATFSQTAPARWVRQNTDWVCLTGASGHAMGIALNDLACGREILSSQLPPDWAVIEYFPGQRIDVRDATGRILTSQPDACRNDTNILPPQPQTPISDFDLLDPCGSRGWYRTDAGQPRARRLDLAIQLQPDQPLPGSLGHALAEVVSLAALEATAICLPIADVGRAPANAVVLDVQTELAPTAHLRIQPATATRSVRLSAIGAHWSLAQLLKKWIHTFSRADGPDSELANQLRQTCRQVIGCLIGRSEMGKWAHALAAGGRPPRAVANRDTHMQLARACTALGKKPPGRAAAPRLFSRTWRHPGEVIDLLRRINAIKPGQGRIDGVLFVSKSRQARLEIQNQCHDVLCQKGYQPQIWVCNAYKPGLCWLLEVILPAIQSAAKAARLEIAFKPFQPGRGQALEMPSRWLQELFPGPDMLIERLDLTADDLVIIQRADLTDTYRVRAWDRSGKLLIERQFSPLFSSFPYLRHRPERGRVHPTCSGMRLMRDAGSPIIKRIQTDRERFWHVFQKAWLPDWEACMTKMIKTASMRPPIIFWDRLEIEVYIDETDEPLNFGHEHIRPMEALHEDIYFVLLEAFSDVATRLGLPDSARLGQIVPRVFAHANKENLWARMRAWPRRADPPAPPASSPADMPQLIGLSMAKWRWKFEIAHDPDMLDETQVEAFWKIMAAWGFPGEPAEDSCHVGVRIPKLPAWLNADPQSACAAFTPGRLPDADTVYAWIARLQQNDRMRIWQAGRSWQKRPIVAMEAVAAGSGAWISTAKMRLLKPTLMINARHHANEVSGTSACLDLAQYLIDRPDGQDILKQANVVMVPLENVDGAALFDTLWPDFKGHKLHAARYNALGAEFYADYHRRQPQAVEALAKKRLWQRWLPQAMIDQHGVPHHEWDQPFSGYAPFRFREFWIPRTFIYVYIPFIAEPDHPDAATARTLARRLSRNMSRSRDIVNLNQTLAARYQRYARQWAPQIFPPSSGQPLLALPFADRVYPHNFAKCYPEITQTELIVEAPDETADGRALELCVAANRIIQDTLLQWIQRPAGEMARTQANDGRVCLTWRPGA